MEVVLYLLKQFVLVLVEVLDLAMLIRAVLSWIDPMEEGGFSAFMVMITEPIILPFRKLCLEKYNNMGLDFALKDIDEASDELMNSLFTLEK